MAEAHGPCAVRLLHAFPHTRCTYNVSFGCTSDERHVWTGRGCRAVFECGVGGVSLRGRFRKPHLILDGSKLN